MRINFNHCAAFSIPKRGCLERFFKGVLFIDGKASSTRLRHLTIRFLASSLLILVTGIFNDAFSGTFTFTGGKRWSSITYLPQKFRPSLVGLLPVVHLSIAMNDSSVACIIWEYTSAYDQPPFSGVTSNSSSGIISSCAR